MTGGIRHPFTGALYEPDGSGGVRVTKDGTVGRFAAMAAGSRASCGRPIPSVHLADRRPPARHHRLSAVEDSHGPAG